MSAELWDWSKKKKFKNDKNREVSGGLGYHLSLYPSSTIAILFHIKYLNFFFFFLLSSIFTFLLFSFSWIFFLCAVKKKIVYSNYFYLKRRRIGDRLAHVKAKKSLSSREHLYVPIYKIFGQTSDQTKCGVYIQGAFSMSLFCVANKLCVPTFNVYMYGSRHWKRTRHACRLVCIIVV